MSRVALAGAATAAGPGATAVKAVRGAARAAKEAMAATVAEVAEARVTRVARAATVVAMVARAARARAKVRQREQATPSKNGRPRNTLQNLSATALFCEYPLLFLIEIISEIRQGFRILASEIGALCQIFRDLYIFSAFPEAALLGTTMGKALKISIYSKISP
jgi:hypothetical protein